MYYFKTKSNGVGISDNQNINGDITWITKEEFNQIVAENEAKAAAEEAARAEAATEQDYLAALEVLGVTE